MSAQFPTATAHDHGRKASHEVAPGEIAVGVVIGRASENFDFFVFGIASALVFPRVFFPFVDAFTGALYAFAVFALAFLTRPLGTWLSMQVQRRWGRGVKLTVALFLLGTATAGIAFLPGYASLGSTAIVLLVLLRLLQGMAVGGSWDGLPSLLAINAPKHRRGWYAMLGQLGAPVGFIVAAALFAYLMASLSEQDFYDWGWRYPFYAAFALNVVALFARLRLVVTEEYEREMDARELEPVSLRELLAVKGRHVVIGAFAPLASYALFHIVTIFPLSWALLFSGQPLVKLLGIQILGGFLAIAGVLFSGLLADRFGRIPTLGGLALAIAMFSGFSPTLLAGGELAQQAFILLGFLLLGLSYGQASGAVTRNFGARYRYTGAALSTDLAWLIGAAFAPLLVLWACARFGLAFLGVYLLSGAISTFVALLIHHRIRQASTAS